MTSVNPPTPVGFPLAPTVTPTSYGTGPVSDPELDHHRQRQATMITKTDSPFLAHSDSPTTLGRSLASIGRERPVVFDELMAAR